jgi:hypothetical protein
MAQGTGTKGQTTICKNTMQKPKDWTTRNIQKKGGNSAVPEGWTLPVPTSDNLRVTVVADPVIGQDLYQIRSDRSEAQIIEEKKLGVKKPNSIAKIG